ncbi:MAG: aminotransferase class V-fold PLP-dependent enzyme [Ferruginibacter sp.]
MKISNQKALFNIDEGVTYMNCANMSPNLKSVYEAGIAAMSKRDAPWLIRTQDWFEPAEELKSLFAKIINAESKSIALVPSASYGIAVAKNNIHLDTSQEIVVLDQQYPSNVYAWRELSKETGAKIITVKKQNGQSWTEAVLENINQRTGLVTIPNCHWTNGGLVDLELIGAKTKEIGAKFVIDASQSLGALPIDINRIKPDFLVTVGYKWLLGPYGLAYLYADEKYHDAGEPIEYTWLNKNGSEDFTKLVDYTDAYKPGASRFDAGGYPSFINIQMAKAALTQILNWGVENIQETISDLTMQISRLANERSFNIADENHAGHLIGLKFNEEKIKEISARFARNNIYISFRGESMRIAPHLFNDSEDIHRLFEYL